MKRKLPKRIVPVAVVLGLVLLAVVGWLAVIHPQRSKATSLAAEIAAVRTEIQKNRLLARPKSTVAAVRLADVFRLSKAMPTEVDMPGILLELNRVAGQAGITFDSISPQAPVATGPYQVIPVHVVFTGNYYELSDLLYRLRNLVEVHDGKLATTGRLFTVDSVQFSESSEKFPKLEATMTINAFVYGAAAASATDATAGAAPAGQTSTSTPTTSAPASTPPYSGPAASASGAPQ
jgi:Tfp pilus assembly protein PilO